MRGGGRHVADLAVTLPQHCRQNMLHAEPHGGETGEDACDGVGERDGHVAVLGEQIGLDREGRVRGVGPEEPGCDERTDVTARREAIEDEHQRDPEREAPGDVRPERGPREGVGRDVYDVRHPVAGGRAERAAGRDRREHVRASATGGRPGSDPPCSGLARHRLHPLTATVAE